jgi:hypothetical protein
MLSALFNLFPYKRIIMSRTPCFSPGINDVIICIYGVCPANPSLDRKGWSAHGDEDSFGMTPFLRIGYVVHVELECFNGKETNQRTDKEA